LNEDIRMIMSNSMNEKLEPTLIEKLKEQQTQLVHNVSGRLEQLLENKISGIKFRKKLKKRPTKKTKPIKRKQTKRRR